MADYLSHLSADDQLVTDFINLNRLNRNVAVVIDSDKRSATSKLNDTKKRIATELRQNHGLEWVTQGREIENYLDDKTYGDAMREMSCPLPNGYEDPYSDRCIFMRDGKAVNLNKLKLAKVATETTPNIDVLDLPEKLETLSAFIRKASGKNI